MRASSIVLLFLVGLVPGGCRTGGEFPSRPVTILVPWSVGGGTDRLTRQIAAQLEGELGVPVNVVNASGGAGVTGHTRGALAEPDGYTMTMVTAELNMLHWRGLTNVTFRDFTPLVRVNRDHAALFVRADAPWASIEDLEEAIRNRPGELRASGTAFGGIWHVALAGWLIQSGLNADDLRWVSLNGSAPSLQELVAGGVEVVVCSIPEAQSLLDAGEVRSLAVMADQRLPGAPDIPTLQETGVDWTSFTWRGLALPLNVPPDRVRMLAAAVHDVVASDEYGVFLDQAGFGVAGEDADAFREALAREDEAFGDVFRSAAFASVRRQTYGPWVFPGVVGGLIGLSLLLSVATRTGTGAPKRSGVPPGGLVRVGGATAGSVFYLLTASVLGYVLTTAVLLFGLFLLLRVRFTVAALTSVVVAATSYHVFGVLLRVPLPWGVLGW